MPEADSTQGQDRRALAVAVAQPPCHAGDVAANAAAHADVVWRAAARVVVFPELSITGYELDAGCVERVRPVLTMLLQAYLMANPSANPSANPPTHPPRSDA